jgi:hypothetical protein
MCRSFLALFFAFLFFLFCEPFANIYLMLQLACTLICGSLLQFTLLHEQFIRRSQFDIIYDSEQLVFWRTNARVIGFLENYRGSEQTLGEREHRMP